MYICKKIKKITYYFLVILIFPNIVSAKNIYINKSIVSGNSIVYGNTGIVIDGKRVSPNSKNKIDSIKIKKINFPNKVNKIFLEADGYNVIVKRGKNYILTPNKSVKYMKIDKRGLLTIKEDSLNEGKTSIFANNLKKLILKGDIKANIFLKIKFLYLKLIGDSFVEFKNIENIDLEFYGDITLKLNGHINSIKLKGKGDVVVISKSRDFILYKNSVDGDISVK